MPSRLPKLDLVAEEASTCLVLRCVVVQKRKLSLLPLQSHSLPRALLPLVESIGITNQTPGISKNDRRKALELPLVHRLFEVRGALPSALDPLDAHFELARAFHDLAEGLEVGEKIAFILPTLHGEF